MKKTIIKILPVFFLLAMFACKNKEQIFPDYKFSSTYFPYQTPVRTLVLGTYDEVDNTKDNNLQFSIGIAIGGLYENEQDRKVGYVLDDNLVKNLYTAAGDTLVALPQAYYTLSPAGTAIVPSGKMQGYIDVQLTDAFLDDPRAFKNRYVIPIRLTSTETDSILSGSTLMANPDPRIANNWTIVPKNYTLYGIKFMNAYQGNFLHKGIDKLTDAGSANVDQVIYHKLYEEQNEVWTLTTTGRSQVAVTGIIRMTYAPSGAFTMLLNFDKDGNCVINSAPTTTFAITGTGKYIKEGGEWGGKKRDAIVLAYKYSAPYTMSLVAVNNNDANIAYTGTWTTTTNENGNQGNDRANSSVQGSSATYKFGGSSIAIYCKTGPAQGTFDVYLDDMNTPVATDISATTAATAFKTKLYEKSGLAVGMHTVKIVTKQNLPVSFDYFEYGSGLPTATYTHTVNDTLVMRDRAVVLETFAPVIK